MIKHKAHRQWFALSIALLAATNLTGVAWAQVQSQSQSLFGSRGPASQIGSNLTGSVVGQSTTLGSSQGSGLFGQPVGGGNQLGAAAQLGQPTTGFVGRDDNVERFVGDQRMVQSTVQNRANRTNTNFGNRARGGTGARFGGGTFGEGNATDRRNRSTRRVIRPRQEIAFNYVRRNTASVSSELNSQFRAISSRDNQLGGVQIAVGQDGIAVLSGTVDSENAKKLAALLVRLEPGVRGVTNDLEIGPESNAR